MVTDGKHGLVRSVMATAVSLALANTMLLPGEVWACPTGGWDVPQTAANGDGVQEANVVTVGAHGSAVTLAGMFGLNATSASASQVGASSAKEARANDLLGIFGSQANVNPDPYLLNAFRNAALPSADTPAAVLSTADPQPAENAFNSVEEGEYGLPADLALRPDIVVGTSGASGLDYTLVMDRDATTSKNYATWGTGSSSPSTSYNRVLAIRSWTDDTAAEGKLNSDGNPYEVSNCYKAGDETYDPVSVSYHDPSSNYGLQYQVADANRLAYAAERVMSQNAGKMTRYGEKPEQVANELELYAKAIKWRILKELEGHPELKKTVALVYDIDSENSTFALLSTNPDGNNAGIGSLLAAEAAQDTVEDLARMVKPTTTAGDMGVKVTAEQLMHADVVICLPQLYGGVDTDAGALRAVLERAGYSEADANWPEVFGPVYPNGAFSTNEDFQKSADALMLVGLMQGFIYPDIVDPVDAMAYFASRFYHLKDEALQEFVRGELAGVSLPNGVSADSVTCDVLSVQRVQRLIDEGAGYYFEKDSTGMRQNKARIDAARPKITSTDTLDDARGCGVGKVKISVPAGMTFTVTDNNGFEVLPGEDGLYVLDCDDASTLKVVCAGYRDYMQQIRASAGENAVTNVTVRAGSMTKMREIAVSIPVGASFALFDATGKRVAASSDGKWYLDVGTTGTFHVDLQGYDTYVGHIAADSSEAKASLTGMTRTVVATKISVPSKSVVTVKDGASAVVGAGEDGAYPLQTGIVYTISVKLDGFEPYNITVTGGSARAFSVRRAQLTRLALSKFACTLSQTSFVYDGTLHRPTVTLTDGAVELEQGSDYTLSYRNNKKAGTATVVITGKGDYAACGTAEYLFAISKAAQEVSVARAAYKVAVGAPTFALGAKTNGDGALSYASSAPKVAAVDAKGKVTVKKAGSAVITISCVEGTNYSAAAAVTIKVDVSKMPQRITAKGVTKTVRASKKTKKLVKAKTFKLSAKAKTTVTYKVAKRDSEKMLSLKGGKVTVKKSAKRGTYTMTVKATAKATAKYAKATKSFKVTVKVK